jgi:uncharacterized protein
MSDGSKDTAAAKGGGENAGSQHTGRYFIFPVVLTVIAVAATAVVGGPEPALIVALLCVLEISISFDNAIVNATVLQTMSEFWQKIFLTVGILIAVFGMRLIFPIVIVAAASGLGIDTVVDQALNDPDAYAKNLEDSNAVIASFGGIFLLMVFLNYFFDVAKDVHWLPGERGLAKAGKLESVTEMIGLAVLLIVSTLVSETERLDVLLSGLVGLLVYLVVAKSADLLAPDEVQEAEEKLEAHKHEHHGHTMKLDVPKAAGTAGFASFMYLEVLDASFSFDGVIGAFAISKSIVVIAIGLGIGALYIRTLTVFLVRKGTLTEYIYLEHGAHWAIGILAVILFVGIEMHVPEVVTGCLGAGVILAAFIASVVRNRREDREEQARGGDDAGEGGSTGGPDKREPEPEPAH